MHILLIRLVIRAECNQPVLYTEGICESGLMRIPDVTNGLTLFMMNNRPPKCIILFILTASLKRGK